MSGASAVRAHGGPPAALDIAAATEAGPSVVVLNEGLAVQRGGRWSFACPRLWGETGTSTDKTPLALSTDGEETFVIGSDDLYAARRGELVPLGRPDLSTSRVIALDAHGGALYGLRIAEGGGSEVVRIGPERTPPLWTSTSYFSGLRVVEDRIYLARLVNDLELGFVTLDHQGQVVAESRAVADTLSSRIELRATPGRLFAVAYDGVGSTLFARAGDGEAWQRAFYGAGVMHGPKASPDGQVWMAIGGQLMRETAAGFEPADEPRGVTCLGDWGSIHYACVGPEMFELTATGLGDRIFTLHGFSAPDPEVVPAGAARECEFQWVLFRNDLMLIGLMPKDWEMAQPVPAGTGDAGDGAPALAGMGASGAAAASGSAAQPTLAAGSGVGPEAAAPSQTGGCAVSPGRDGASVVLWAGCVGWALARRRRGSA